MNRDTLTLAKHGLVTPRYLDMALEARNADERLLHSIVAQRRMPEFGVRPQLIEHLLSQFSLMDSNNFVHHCGGGEREGRVFSNLVSARHRFMTHGIGRSGDITADQPKAAGSSLMSRLANVMVTDALRVAGWTRSLQKAIVVPMCTGMSLALVLRGVFQHYKRPATAKFVVWPRIDQKTCVKCIAVAGFEVAMVPLRRAPPPKHPSKQRHHDASRHGGGGVLPDDKRQQQQGHHAGGGEEPPVAEHSAAYAEEEEGRGGIFLQSHPDDVRAAIARVGGPDYVVCVMTTTSCFAPRLPDDVLSMGRVCHEHGLPHVVNNAYGVQSPIIMSRIDAAAATAPVDDNKHSSRRRRPAAGAASAEGQTTVETVEGRSSPPLAPPRHHGSVNSAPQSRVDAVVQSGDKNFLVPVGGAVIAGPADTIDAIAALYAGRASATPSMDLFITLLEMGRIGWLLCLSERIARLGQMKAFLQEFASARGEALWCDPRNEISMAVTLRRYHPSHHKGARSSISSTAVSSSSSSSVALIAGQAGRYEELGARLFAIGVTGPRVVLIASSRRAEIPRRKATRLGGMTFATFGAHADDYCCFVDSPRCGKKGTRTPTLVGGEDPANDGAAADTIRVAATEEEEEEDVVPPALLVVACGIGMTEVELTALKKKLCDAYPVTKDPPSKHVVV